MPGGLARVAESRDQTIDSKNLSGSRSKDMWILSDTVEADIDVPLDSLPGAQAEAANLPSRVIENLFWFGRHRRLGFLKSRPSYQLDLAYQAGVRKRFC